MYESDILRAKEQSKYLDNKLNLQRSDDTYRLSIPSRIIDKMNLSKDQFLEIT